MCPFEGERKIKQIQNSQYNCIYRFLYLQLDDFEIAKILKCEN